MESKFFTFVRPYLDYIDSGRFFRQPFCWLYSVLAVLNLLFPLIVLAQSCRLGVFHAGGKGVIAFIIAFLLLDMFLMNRALGFGFLDFSFMGIVLFPIYGFLIVIVARVVAEIYRALAAIANNTKKS